MGMMDRGGSKWFYPSTTWKYRISIHLSKTPGGVSAVSGTAHFVQVGKRLPLAKTVELTVKGRTLETSGLTQLAGTVPLYVLKHARARANEMLRDLGVK